MKETGILFTPDNHRLILSDQKVQTRRVITPQPDHCHRDIIGKTFPWDKQDYNRLLPQIGEKEIPCPYGTVGDRLYVKEGVITHYSIPQLIGYYMDGCRVTEHWEKRLTAMYMPKWAARTWLEITNVKVERVQDISEEDCIAEGCPKEYLLGRNWYKHLWDEINGKKHPFHSNPWVWAITFRRIKP